MKFQCFMMKSDAGDRTGVHISPSAHYPSITSQAVTSVRLYELQVKQVKEDDLR